MDAIKGLKYALVMVLVVSVALLGWTTYLERKQSALVEQFAREVGRAQTEAEAKAVIKNFLQATNTDSKALSASADVSLDGWLVK